MTQRLSFKSGSTFKVALVYAPTAGLAPATLATVTITSQVRSKSGKLIATLTAEKTGDTTFKLSAETTDWPHGVEVDWDVKLSDATYGTFYTETVTLVLEKRVTA